MDTEIVVVGAGPTGLTLAIELARRGIAHTVIDAAEGPAIGSRGKGLQPRSLEVFDDLGIVEEILMHGTIGLPLRVHQGFEPIVELATATGAGPQPGVPYPDLLVLPEWRVEQVLRDRLSELGGKVRYGSRPTTFEQDNESVSVTLENGDTIAARYLIGCDGGHSAVRRWLGLTMTGETKEDQFFLVGDVKVEGLPADIAYAWFGDGGSYLAVAPLPDADGAWQYQANVLPEADGTVAEPTLALFRELFRERSGRPDVVLNEAGWFSRFRFNARMVSKYRVGRIFLAGDAAHVHTPAGGQGMNTGIQDAYNLGWKLAAVVAGAPDTLLDSYGIERIPVAAKVIAASSRTAQSLFGLTGWQRFLRDHLIFPVLERPAVMRLLLAKANQLDIGYRDSPLTATDNRGRGPRPGDRAPDARGTTTDGTPLRLFDALRGTQWTVLGFGAATAPDLTSLEHTHPDLRTQLIIDSGTIDNALIGPEAARVFRARPGTLILIRPDGYLAARTTDPERITNHLTAIR